MVVQENLTSNVKVVFAGPAVKLAESGQGSCTIDTPKQAWHWADLPMMVNFS